MRATVCRRFNTDVVPIIDKAGLKARLALFDKEPFVLIDVREPNELVHGVIPRSINIPSREVPAAFGLRPGEWLRKYGVPKPVADETEIFFYCRAGPRALNAAKTVNAMGFDKTVCYYGSYMDWASLSAEQYPAPSLVQTKQ